MAKAKFGLLGTSALALLLHAGVAGAQPEAAGASAAAASEGEAAAAQPAPPTLQLSNNASGQGAPGESMLPAVPDEAPQEVTRLEEALALAYRRNPTLLSERANLRGTDETVVQARAAYGIQSAVTGGYTFADDAINTGLPAPLTRSGGSYNIALSLQQTIFSSGRNYAQYLGAVNNVDLGRQNLRITESNVLSNVISTYVAVRRDATLVGIAQENLSLLERQYGDSEQRFEVREVTITDLQQAETRLELARSQLLEAQARLQVSRSNFLRFVGAVPRELAPMPDLPGVPTGIADAYDAADESSALILGARARERVSRSEYARTRSEYGPEVSLRGTLSNSSTSPYSDSLRQRQLRGEVLVSLPLFDTGLRRSRERQAAEFNDADRRLVDQTVRDVRQLVAQAWSALVAARASLDHYTASVRAAELAYEGAVIQERAGFRTTLDVLDLARDLLTVRTNLVNAQANEYLARSGLLAAMGRLEARHLITGVDLYDPLENYERVRRSGDLPWTSLLIGLDGAQTEDLRSDRPLRDDAAPLRLEGSEPLPPPPEPQP